MGVMLAIVTVWSILFLVFHGAMTVKMIGELLSGKEFDGRTFTMHCGMAFMFFVVALDAVLRVFSPAHTGLW